MGNDKIDKVLNESLNTSTIIDDVKSFAPNIFPLTTTSDFKQSKIDFSDNKKEKINKYLNDTVLPSKSQLNESDPFSQIISSDYLLYFVFGASVALFMFKLFS